MKTGPVYRVVAYDAICFDGNEGLYYVSITQFCIVLFALIMVTLRIAFKPGNGDSTLAASGVTDESRGEDQKQSAAWEEPYEPNKVIVDEEIQENDQQPQDVSTDDDYLLNDEDLDDNGAGTASATDPPANENDAEESYVRDERDA
jgi:hypothetical protein